MSLKKLSFILTVLVLSGCKNFTEKENNRNVNYDLDKINVSNIKLYTDKNANILIEQLKDVYLSAFPEASMDITYTNDNDVKEAIFNNSSRLVIRLQEFDKTDLKYLNSIYQTKPIQFVFAYDAIALVKNKTESDTLISIDSLNQFILQGKDKFVSTQEHIDMFTQLLFQNKITEGSRSIKTVKDIDDLKRFLQLHPDYIGLLPFSLVSNPDDKNTEHIISKFNWIAIKDSLGHIVHPSQSTIYTKEWPLILPYTVTYCNLSLKEGVGFVKFIHSRQAQKLILKAGLIPYTMPERLVIITDQMFDLD